MFSFKVEWVKGPANFVSSFVPNGINDMNNLFFTIMFLYFERGILVKTVVEYNGIKLYSLFGSYFPARVRTSDLLITNTVLWLLH